MPIFAGELLINPRTCVQGVSFFLLHKKSDANENEYVEPSIDIINYGSD